MRMQIAGGVVMLVLFLVCLAHLGVLIEVPGSWFLMFIAASAAVSYLGLGVAMLVDAWRQRQEEKQRAEYIKRMTIWPGK